MKPRKVFIIFAFFFASLAILTVIVAPAHTDEVSHARIVRLSFVEGDAAYQRPGSTWQRAMMNLPLQQDFSLRTDAGYAEVECESGLAIYLAQNTQVEFTGLSMLDGGKVTSVKLDQGTIITTANLSHGDQLSIAVGNMDVTVPRSGRFRVDATESQNWVTVFHGKVDVANGTVTTGVESGKTLHFDSVNNSSIVDRSPQRDAFDKWVAQRDQAEESSQSNAGSFISRQQGMLSVGDLYDYGIWSNIPGYGMGWQPYGLGPGWMPFGDGMWMFDELFDDPTLGGWTWASFEPWGWLPYHYGAWANVPGQGWFWLPQNLGVFQPATASFVNVGNQVGWTPKLATPVNPGKIKTRGSAPIQVVFAGKAANGVIMAGPRGQLNSAATLKTASGPAASFAQPGAPNQAILSTSGVTLTGRAPARPMSTTLTYTTRGTASANNGARTNLGAPSGPPTSLAPHSAAVPVERAPSTFASSNSGGTIPGGAGTNSGASAVGSHAPTAPTGGPSAGAPAAGGGATGGSAPIKH